MFGVNIHLPNFFIVGVPKAGTTTLYNYLKEHPDVYMSPVKEPNFFSYKYIKKQKLYYRKKNVKTVKHYQKLFRGVKGEKAVGEASVSYLFYPEVPRKIIDSFPEAKIIIILRDPVKRAFSHYLMDLRLGYTHSAFEEIIFDRSKNSLYYQQYIELGLYYSQVKRYVDTFNSEKLKIMVFEEFVKDEKKQVSSIYRFLNVDPSFFPRLEGKYNRSIMPRQRLTRFFYGIDGLRKCLKLVLPDFILNKSTSYFFNSEMPNLEKETENFLQSFYSEDVRKLKDLLKKDLECWSVN